MAEQGLEDRPEQLTLSHAEAEFQRAMTTIGEVREELEAWAAKGDLPNAGDIKAAIKLLSEAWHGAQKERNYVADYARKHGERLDGELDLQAARLEVCERLDRIAAALTAG